MTRPTDTTCRRCDDSGLIPHLGDPSQIKWYKRDLNLLNNPKHVNRAWDEAIDQGRANNGYPDVVPEAGE